MAQTNSESSSMLLKIKALEPSLSKAEQRVVSYILNHPNEVISLSVAGLAENSGVSDATVVRTCKSLGLGSYQQFKVALAKDLVTPLQSIHTEILPDDTPEMIIHKVFQENIHTLEYTRNTLSTDSLIQAAKQLVNAEQVIIYGLGNSHAIATDLQHKLMRLGIHAHAYTDSHIQKIAAVNCQKGDVVFAISHSGSSIDVVDCARRCHEKGAVVISLTNIGRSPLSKISDISLTTASRETQFHIVSLASRIAQMTIIDCLYTLIALEKPDITETFYEIEQALEQKKY